MLDMDKTHAGHAVGKTEPNRYSCHGAFASLWSSENVQSLFRGKPVELNYSIASLLWATRHFQQPDVERKREKAYGSSLLLDFSSFYKIFWEGKANIMNPHGLLHTIGVGPRGSKSAPVYSVAGLDSGLSSMLRRLYVCISERVEMDIAFAQA